LKEEPKSISERATRFLAVDMKDRLKSAFNRGSGGNAPESEAPRVDDTPDYSSIFAHRAQAAQKKPPAPAPANQPLLAEPPTSVTMRNPARQIAHDIEEAQIVAGPGEEAAGSPVWEAVSLKTRKAEVAPEVRRAAAPEIATETQPRVDIAGVGKPSTVVSKPTTTSALDPAAVAKPVAEAKPIVREDIKPSMQEAGAPAVEVTSSKREDPVAPKSKFRFFNDSAESVRLKVEKRPEERPAAEPAATATAQPAAAQPARPEPKPVEVKAQSVPAPSAGIVRTPEPVEQSKSVDKAPTQAAAVAPAASEQPNFKPQKENASMDAKGQEIDNGAAAKADGNGTGAAIAIERNSKFSGQLKFSGAIAIDGQVEGELVAERIVVHEGGVVNATIEGNTVVIAGNVKGDVYARNELEILPSGVVHGSVTSPAINVRRGGRVEGRCAIGVPRP
jgi:cytoskeletal protein CcmA (bactofilin family)